MILKTAGVALAAAFSCAMMGCSDDDAAGGSATGDGGDGGGAGMGGTGAGGEPSAGGTGASGGSGGGEGGSGGAGGSGGIGGSGGTDARTTCIEAQPEALGAECAECRCDTCLTEIEACNADAQCAAILECTTAVNCFGTECYAPGTCQDVFDANGGPVSPSVDLLISVGNCSLECASQCGGAAEGDPIPATITVTDGTDPIEGAEICILDSTDCATTDAAGEASLDVPALSEVALSVVASGYTTVLLGAVTGPSSADLTTTMTSTADTEAAAAAAGITLDDTKGAIGFTVFGPDGVNAALSPDSGTLVYTDQNGDPDASLNGGVSGAAPTGIFWNVDPGDYDLTFSHADTTCQAGAVGTWASSTPGAARVAVVAGAFSSGGHYGTCDALP